MMKSIEKKNIVILLLATLLLIITSYSVEGKSAMDKKNAGTRSDMNSNTPPLTEEDYNDDDEINSPEIIQPQSTLHPYFAKNESTIYIKPKELGQPLTLNCPVKNIDDKQQIVWFEEKNNIAVGKNSLTNAYEVDDVKYRLIVKNYNVTAPERNFYCEVLPHHVRFHILVKVGEGGTHISTPPEQILASGMPETSAATRIPIFETIHLISLLMTTLGTMKLLQVV